MASLSQIKKLILAFLVIAFIAVGWWIFLSQTNKPRPNINTNTVNTNASNSNTASNDNLNAQPANINESIDALGWKTYRNEELGFEVKYPNELSVVENNPSFNFKSNAKDQTNVSFENERIINDCGCGIYIRVEDNKNQYSTDDWLNSTDEKNDNYISQKQFDEQKNSTNESIRIFAGEYSESQIKINSVLSLRQNYATEGGGYDRVLIPINDKIYIITARSDSYYFNKKNRQTDGGKLANIFEEIIQNFSPHKE